MVGDKMLMSHCQGPELMEGGCVSQLYRSWHTSTGNVGNWETFSYFRFSKNLAWEGHWGQWGRYWQGLL